MVIKMKTAFILTVLFLTADLFALDTTSSKYFPLNVGNSWTYDYTSPSHIHSTVRCTITSSQLINGHIYYYLNNMPVSGPGYYRIDSLTGNLLFYTTSGCSWLQNEVVIDSLQAKLNNYFLGNCSYSILCSDTNNISVWGLIKKHKEFTWFLGNLIDFVRDIGITYKWIHLGDIWDLLGCVINGTVYGDTTLTGINKISNEVPTAFSLSQNYSNPFNPSTKINFSIPKSSKLKIVIYDVTGKVIETLVDQQLSTGTFAVDWNASKYSSGVYFYKLESEEFVDIKRMVLIK